MNPTLSAGWSGNTYRVTMSGSGKSQSKSTTYTGTKFNVTNATVRNTYYMDFTAAATFEGDGGNWTTNYANASINAKKVYDKGISAGKKLVHSLSSVTLSASDKGTSTKDVTIFFSDDDEVDKTISINASAVYTAGQGAMGVIIDKDGGRLVKSGKATKKSVVIGITANDPTYDSTTHKYSFSASANADDTAMQSATKTTGTEAYLAGWNAACASISRRGNIIIGPKSGSPGSTETKYAASYVASSYTKETTTTGYYEYISRASTHSHSSAWVRLDSGSRIYSDTNMNISGDHTVTFDSGSDSYEQERTATASYTKLDTASSYTASSLTWS